MTTIDPDSGSGAARPQRYQILVERGAEKELKRIAAEVRPKLVEAIKSLAENPRPAGCRKLVGLENDWRIRVGNYRIVYEIADEVRIVRVNRVLHRKDSYR
jgi:mRNA interferase RelE/StbE